MKIRRNGVLKNGGEAAPEQHLLFAFGCCGVGAGKWDMLLVGDLKGAEEAL